MLFNSLCFVCVWDFFSYILHFPISYVKTKFFSFKGTHVLHQIIYDYLILYTHIYCKDARDLDIIVSYFVFVFVFWFFSFLFFCGFCGFGLLLHIVLNFSLKLCTT